jgi:NAD-dependent DNA ligase
MSDSTVMHKRGIQRRLQVSKNIAHIIKKTFTTAESLIEAVETHDDLTEIRGIGPQTASAIEDWWDIRYEREVEMNYTAFDKPSDKAMNIYLINSWEDALEQETDE